MKHVIEWAPFAGLANIFFDKLEARIIPQMIEVAHPPGQQIVGRDDRIALAEQSVAQMRAEKARSSRHQRALRFHSLRRAPFSSEERRPSILRLTPPDDPHCNKRIRDRPSLADHTDSAHRAR